MAKATAAGRKILGDIGEKGAFAVVGDDSPQGFCFAQLSPIAGKSLQ